MDNPVRKMVLFNPRLLSLLKQISRDTGIEPDDIINLALYELGRKLGHVKSEARKVPPPIGVDLLDEVEPSPPPSRPPSRPPKGRVQKAAQNRPPRPPQQHKQATDTLFIQLDDGPMIPVRKKVFLIGRGSKCDHIIHHRSVSREHVVITKERNGWFIEDLNSANGTWLDGEQITKHKISGGEEFNISNHVLRVNIRAG